MTEAGIVRANPLELVPGRS